MKNKRFIAGASCPSCNELDKIFIYEESSQRWRACASCDFKESIDDFLANTEELPTRVNQHRLGEQPLAHETPLERVTLVDAPPGKGQK